MRTTLDIGDDVLLAAKELARIERRTLGEVITALSRRGFASGAASQGDHTSAAVGVSERLASYGIQPLPARGGIVTNELIDRLSDQEGV